MWVPTGTNCQIHRRRAARVPGVAGSRRGPRPAWAVASDVAGAARLAVVLPEDLPVAEFAFPGPLRDQLVAAILSGTKTTTSGLVADYEHEGDPLPWAGLRQAVTDSAG